ncbi:MAG TPA: DUF1553 domain-containing protein [Chitinophagaceae bacterium]|nr:DUF1553 domain-containing protein [Chitinophagaceae bacterium]
MNFLLSRKVLFVIIPIIAGVALFVFSSHQSTVDFNTQVKPIFNKKCIACHGGVRRKSGFSLLFRADALAKNKSGKPAIIPGDPDHSEMIRRLTSNDPDERMPYKHEALSGDEISILRRWIRQGAKWGEHWAYVPVKPVDVPHINTPWARNEIDHFIYQKLDEEKLKPAAEADKATLLRRASLDLIGMPAPEEIAEQFFKSNNNDAYQILIDSLLSSKHFGEKWAAMWLDLARYADTKGYERDDSRSIWHYRDWLINAFNKDEPYDQFLTEQIAGDLLPDPTDDQYVATAFHRNTMTNDEGGTDNEEFRTAAVIDRVNTTWQALMGTTFGCVQCHSHPYDPFTHDEYYKFMAFFNDTRDEDAYDDYPLLRHFNDSMQQQLQSLTEWLQENISAQRAKEINRFLRTWQPSINSLTADQFVNSELADTKFLVFRNHAVARLKHVDLENKNLLIYRYTCWKKEGVWSIHLDRPDGPVLKTISPDTTSDWKIAEVEFPLSSGIHDIYFTYSNTHLKKQEDNGQLMDWFCFTQQFPGKGIAGYEKNKKIFWSLLTAKVPTTPIMMDNPATMHRATNVFERGNWLVKGDVVTPAIPHALNPMPKNAPNNRLGLAMWITSKQNPLTARTMVNRVWEQLFGNGLAETLEDLGTQGIPPTHKELLDWLSWKFMKDYNWSVKKLLKEIVMSATYRQDSKVTRESLEKDPANKLYGRGARVRLSAEQVRDQGLSVSGLMNEKMFGPSVFPYQPKGIWLSPWNGAYWQKSQGQEQYRRALYTYWKRTAPYPSMMMFDGTAREVCTARRIRTNTPLQALVTLNDSAYLEMARYFAYRMQKAGNDPKQQISKGYQVALYKPISAPKLSVLMKLYDESFQKFKKDKDETCEMIGQNDEHNNPETAAMVVVANAILNLDEVITKN